MSHHKSLDELCARPERADTAFLVAFRKMEKERDETNRRHTSVLKKVEEQSWKSAAFDDVADRL